MLIASHDLHHDVDVQTRRVHDEGWAICVVHLLEFDGLALLRKNHRAVFSVFRVFRKLDPVE